MKKGLNEFFTDLGEKEAHGDYTEFNDYDYLGKYQMGEAALVDTGYYMDEHIDYSGKCDWKGTFTGKDGVYSRNDFLNNPQAQENANMEYKKKEWAQLKSYNADKFLGKKVKGILITQSGLLAAAHLKGASGTANCIKNPNSKLCNPNDAYGTSIYKYLEKFAGYDVSEITGLPSDAFDFPDDEKQKLEQKQPKQKEDKNNQIQEKQEPQTPQAPKTPKTLKTKQKRQLSPEELEKAVDKAIVRIYIATIIYGLCYFSAKEGNIQDSTMTLKRVLRIVAKNNNMTMKELVDFLLKKIRELDEYEHKKYMMKYLKPSVSYNQNNSMKFQSQKPLNMNFAELIKPQQVSTVSYEQFYPERKAFVNNTSNINYGNKKFSANNTIKMQNEKNPVLYKGTTSKPGVIPNNASGYSLLNTAKASLIPQIEYVLPKFNSPKVELDTSPISRTNINPIAQNDYVSNLNNLNIANNNGQNDDIFNLLINAIKKKNS